MQVSFILKSFSLTPTRLSSLNPFANSTLCTSSKAAKKQMNCAIARRGSHSASPILFLKVHEPLRMHLNPGV